MLETIYIATIKNINKINQLHAVPGLSREPGVKTLRSPLSAEEALRISINSEEMKLQI